MRADPPIVAVLDDEPNMRKALQRLLRQNGFEAVLFESAAGFLVALKDATFACLLLDLHTPELDGFGVLERLAADARLPVIVITGRDQPGYSERVARLGASSYLTKPVDRSHLLDAIRKILA